MSINFSVDEAIPMGEDFLVDPLGGVLSMWGAAALMGIIAIGVGLFMRRGAPPPRKRNHPRKHKVDRMERVRASQSPQ